MDTPTTTATETQETPLYIDHGDTRTVDQGQQPQEEGASELQRHKEARGYVKPPTTDKAPPPLPETTVDPPAKPEEEKKPERWQDPDTGDHYDMRHKVARRIKAVLEDRGKERSRAEAAERRVEELTRMLVERGATPKQAEETAKATVAEDPEPDPADTTKYPEGQFDRAFIRDMGRWAARQETRTTFDTAKTEAAEARERQAEAEQVKQWQGTLPEARKKYADFDEALKKIPNTTENAPIARLMMRSPVGNDLVYALANQTTSDGSGRVMTLMQLYDRAPDMDSRLRLLYHIEAQLIQAARAATTRTTTSTTKAPPPTDPVHTAAGPNGPTDWSRNDDPDQVQRWKQQRGYDRGRR